MDNKHLSSQRIIGAHVSTQGGFSEAMKRAHAIEVCGVQIFGASPVQWKARIPSDEDIALFLKARTLYGIEKVFLHAPYLINLCSPKEALQKTSQQLLLRHLEIANALHAEGVIFHIGSRGNMDRDESIAIVIASIQTILETVPRGMLFMENNAGAGNLVGDSLDELAHIYHGVQHERFGVCIDTAHAFASGLITSFDAQGISEFAHAFDTAIGLSALRVFHVNDSKVAAGTKKDRHENIGMGHIGAEGIGNFINYKAFSSIPIILEVPGFDGGGPDKKNVDIVKQLLSDKK